MSEIDTLRLEQNRLRGELLAVTDRLLAIEKASVDQMRKERMDWLEANPETPQPRLRRAFGGMGDVLIGSGRLSVGPGKHAGCAICHGSGVDLAGKSCAAGPHPAWVFAVHSEPKHE